MPGKTSHFVILSEAKDLLFVGSSTSAGDSQ
jgi:hypothetical protein